MLHENTESNAVWKTFEEEDEVIVKIPWTEMLARLVLLFFFAPLGWMFGLCRWELGVRAHLGVSSLKLLYVFPLYLAAMHVFLVWPLTDWVLPQVNLGRVWRGILTILFIFAPISSFGYYVGDNSMNWGDVPDLLLVVVPPTILGFLYYERTGKAWVLTLILGTATFLSYFVVNDLLSPYRLVFSYASNSGNFYYWRVFLPVSLVVFSLVKENVTNRPTEDLKWSLLLLAAVGAYCTLLHFGMSAFENEQAFSRLELSPSVQSYFTGALIGAVVGLLAKKETRRLLIGR